MNRGAISGNYNYLASTRNLDMKSTSLNIRAALVLSIVISLVMNLLFFVIFIYGKDAVIPPDEDNNPDSAPQTEQVEPGNTAEVTQNFSTDDTQPTNSLAADQGTGVNIDSTQISIAAEPTATDDTPATVKERGKQGKQRDKERPDHRHRSGKDDLMHLSINFIRTFLFVFVLFLVNFRIMRINMKERIKLALIILSTTALAIVLSIILTRLHFIVFEPPWKYPERIIRANMTRELFLSVIVIFSSQLLYLVNRRQKMALDYESLMAENVRTRYEALKNQVDPHFLFNSLNTLNSIIKSDPDKAQEYVQQLSFVFRYTLQTQDVITLEEELRFTRAYCSLMQIRYGEALSFVFEIEPEYNEYKIIPLSVQTLVENAIKHNVVSLKKPLTVTISTEGDTITVSNPIQPKKTCEPGEGIGLSNLAERYRLQWEDEITVVSDENIFSVTIPLFRS